MGKLAMWGAVAGGAEGWEENIKQKTIKENADLDAQRQERLEKMRQTHTETMASRREEHEVGLQEMRGEQAIGVIEAEGTSRESLEKIRDTYTKALQDDAQAANATEGNLDRESRERVAKINQYGSSSSARSALERYVPKILSVGQANEYGIQIETDTPAVYDKLASKWYVQDGDKLTFPGDTAPSARAPASAVGSLYKNPERADIFYREYGYLPADYLGVLNEAAIAAYDLQVQE